MNWRLISFLSQVITILLFLSCFQVRDFLIFNQLAYLLEIFYNTLDDRIYAYFQSVNFQIVYDTDLDDATKESMLRTVEKWYYTLRDQGFHKVIRTSSYKANFESANRAFAAAKHTRLYF